MQCLDFEKAFDSLDWKCMTEALKACQFGDDICRWIATFYRRINSTVIVNSDSKLHRGSLLNADLGRAIHIMRGNSDKRKC